MTVKGVYSKLDLKINVLTSELRKVKKNLQKSQMRLELIALGRDKVILSNEFDIFAIPVVPRMVGRPSSRLPKKYHLLDTPKFTEEQDGYKRPFSTAERKKKMLCLNRPYRYALAKQPPEQVMARSEQL